LERLTAALADRYTVEREIGRGGMATVFLAEDLKHHRKVAIKVLHPELGAAVGPDRFLREIEAVAGLTHPHVLPLHDSGEADGLLFFMMPYVEGESLRHRLDRERQLPVDEAIRITQDVAEALDHAHRHGLIHRDIKPGNILLEEGHAVVTDFGVARALSEVGQEKVTATGVSVGTPAYTSPEQASGGEVDERSDLYALGCVLYEMLAGEPPLVGSTLQATAAKRLTDRPTPLPVLRSTVSPELEHAVQKALERSPADRYATAAELAAALESGMSERVGAAPARRRRRTLLTVAIAICAVAVAVAGWLALRSTDSTQAADQASIAVLPFLNMSEDPGNEYFSDGISEELLNLLAKIPELRVTSRSSAFSFKGQNLTIAEIAERLNVAYILEGSVRKAGDDVRITAQLIDARSDTHLWSETWDRRLEDIFEIQDEIAAEVVAQFRITLLGSLPTVAETHPEAHALVLQARNLHQQGFLEPAADLYLKALDIDPQYARGWAELADLYAEGSTHAGMHASDRAREAARRALAIDPDCELAYGALGYVALGPGNDLDQAAIYFSQALQLDPTNTEIISSASVVARALGRLDDAIALLEYVTDRDPVNPGVLHRLGLAYRWAGRLDEAIASFRSALALSPMYGNLNYSLGVALLLEGETEEALGAMQRETGEAWRLLGLAMAYHTLGQTAASDASLAEAIARFEQDYPINIAYVFAYRNEADCAFEWLDKAVEYGDPGLTQMPVMDLFANIRDDPRWTPFLQSIGESPEQLAAIQFEVTLPQ
jgi:serine/threonine-protein kinase